MCRFQLFPFRTKKLSARELMILIASTLKSNPFAFDNVAKVAKP
jgi:hypothetical protein